MTKALLIEKAKDNEQIANYIEKIVEIINKDKENYSNNIKEIFKIMLTQIIKNKIGKEIYIAYNIVNITESVIL